MAAARHSDSIGHWLTWQRPGQDERELGRSMAMALARSGLCVMLQDEQGRYLFIINLFDLWRVDGDPNDLTLFGEKIANQLADLKRRVTETQKADQLEVVVGYDRAFEFSVEQITTSSGKMHLLTRVVDLTDKRNAERITENLMKEVSHRSKNLLAIVQSIAVQTARQTHSVEKFIEDFRGRLMAISRAQDLVTESSWRGAWLHDLIELQADGYVPEGNGAINFKGLNIRLEPSAALHVGLALHELITNAVANRSFKGNGTASVTVDCWRTSRDGEDVIQIRWLEQHRERGDQLAATADPTTDDQPFSRILLERVVPASVYGKAEYSNSATTTFYELVFPAPETN